ncbi:T9SS C-terminal target domain-containing protein [Chryseobacterium lactis]|uniref:T9SS C-terminal target domain-containing protein n=1 Tax=Chryseobacterium lactis TaxID=1241981 RepID=A0A3G6RFP7_CHRLC|nr:T9SS type A sorting domain-containing protein [Chryseobacterium lactis]AZA82607.1 T9SS C-terminal target domain-containing protein [Chryseobacterium lactis]AZB02988.1 T9SS C-terminal target domain-containing protein [Chryseobacterium lactis]PNW11872.1 T9SS C-terminal target domain-containing protein [Chryseobacterium lactis]
MKNIYLFVLFLAHFAIHAQIVTIPDPKFKAKLLTANTGNNPFSYDLNGNPTIIDTNNDGEIQVSEAQNISKLTLGSTQINDITGIKSFTNLVYFNLTGNAVLNSVDLSNMTQLKELYSYSNALNILNVQGCNQLETFFFSNNSGTISNLSFLQNLSLKKISISANAHLGSADISNLTTLEDIYFGESSNVNFTSLDLSNNINLKKLYIIKPNLTSLTFNTLSNLEYVNIQKTKITSLDFTNSPLLANLDIDKNSLLSTLNIQNNSNLKYITISTSPLLTSLSVQNNPNLLGLTVGGTSISSLNLTGLTAMFNLSLGDNKITSLDVSPATNLVFLSLGEDFLTSIDASQNPKLASISAVGNALTHVNVKNGKPTLDYSAGPKSFSPNLAYVCCDTKKIQTFSTMLANYGHNNVEINSYCSFVPGGTVYTVQGNTKVDVDNNGCDSTDPGKAFQKFTITDGTNSGTYIANNSGNYSLAVQAGANVITPVLENPAYFTISPTSITADFPAQASPLIQNFCMTPNGTHNDLEMVILPITAATPGFQTQYKLVYKNKGNTVQSGTLAFNYNDSISDYQASTLTPNSQSPGVLNWNFTNLLPFESKEITVTIKLNTPTQTPPLSAGDILHYTAQINGAATDETPVDNSFTLNRTVVNSFDPNDKTCLEGASIAQAKVGDYVHYLIRFENTGTANARSVVIKDEIDTTKFDLASLVAFNGSHDFVTKITGPNVVEFIFENIQLPFDDVHNDGYVSFKIKTKSTLNAGDSFSNTAKIYFDYNHPIITNTATTSVESILATTERSKDNTQFTIYPNPVKDVLNIKSKDEVIKAEIYDGAGRIINSTQVKGNSVNVSELSKGNYMIKVSTKNKTMTQKFIKD